MDHLAKDFDLSKGAGFVRRTLSIGEFSFRALGGAATRHRVVLGCSLSVAIGHYLDARDSTPPDWPPLALRAGGTATATEVEFCMEDQVWSELTREAAKQHVTARDLLRHAVLVFVSDRDAGHLGRRVVGAAAR